MKILQNTAFILAADSKDLPSMLAAVLSAMMSDCLCLSVYLPVPVTLSCV